ncbi:MAG TPA: nuclear transport factor 2 family protein [Acidimicrobiales bacterium]|nr:nuclear transport factor 2 family protein [Acidimicrobiales bacterium]
MPLTVDDRLSIHELVALHGHLADERREDELHLLLTEDATYDISAYGMGVVRGLDALVKLFAERPGQQPAGHHVTNVIVTAGADDDGSATVRSKGLAVMPDGTTGTVTYADEVVRTPAGWRISLRTVIPARAD